MDKLGDPERPPITEPHVMKDYNEPRYPRAARAGMISRMDREIGRIRALLEELELAENTLVVFSGDNGPCTAGGQDVAFFRSRRGLRGEKRTLYEGAFRVPTISYQEALSPTFINCRFTGNIATNDGRAVSNHSVSSPRFTGCIFKNNSAERKGGAFLSVGGNPTLTNCVLANNLCDGDGGASYSGLNLSLKDCVFTRLGLGDFQTAGP